MTAKKPVEKSEEEWRKELDPLQHHVLRDHGTERPFTSPLNSEKRTGIFHCAGCGEPLFDSKTKYEGGPQGAADPDAALAKWSESRTLALERVDRLKEEIAAAGQVDLAMLSVATSELRSLV